MSPLEKNLRDIAGQFSPVALAHSLQAEDMVLTDIIARAGLPIELFVLDTGRLHADSLELLDEIRRHYSIDVRVHAPDAGAVSEYLRRHGRDAFYGSVELRKRCCEIRKVEPLARALAGKRAWITGQRRAQSASRGQLAEREFDATHALEKFNPLAAWTETDVWDYLRAERVPYNRLYDQGYRSIGCAPCTRPVTPGEDLRAGRWWWEGEAQKECGLHITPDGRVVRAKEPA
ncbi:MAG: phosphoadenosine phosphosulfate reductase [Betaproteobacteria bacterium]|jgi:phosphoadenosine phosphosulfate reductase|nr:phosphoadenosine phosphosulfate reductase [Betaproteobacteria bacterium]